MKEEGPGLDQGLRHRRPLRGVEGAQVPGRDPGLAPGLGQETEAGRRQEEALQEPDQDPQDQEVTRGPSAILITLLVVKAAEEEEEEEELKERLQSPTSAWACLA